MPQNPIRLDDLLAREVTPQWYEGVALVQEVCRQVCAGATVGGFPGASDIWLAVDGAVAVRDGASHGTGAPEAGRLLSHLLGEDAPVRLRLLATQATGAGPHDQTLEELSRALGYFERPDSRTVLKALYERASVAPNRADPGAAVVPLASEENTADPAALPLARRRTWRRSVPVAAGLLMGATVWLLAKHPAAPVDATLSTLATGVRVAVSEPPGVARDTERTRVLPLRATDVSAAASTLGPVPPFTLALPLLRRRYESPLPLEAAAIEIRATPPPADRLYSDRDPAVVPPRSIYSKLPASTSSRASLKDASLLEMVIGTSGAVESVRLLTPPRNVHEFMLVSAAKAWQFAPATLEGTPVRFRHRVVVFPY